MRLKGIEHRRNTASFMMLFFVALAFSVKALLPSGFMPVVNKDGFTQIVICSGMGEKTITVPSDGMPSQDHQNAPSDKVCAYHILASAKGLIPLLDAYIQTSEIFVIAYFPVTALSVQRRFEHIQNPRAPPSLA